jgi:predicted unusual protein kinase regulating ubiquinone biosynthesis (AarF/ABC1/UbiB family)
LQFVEGVLNLYHGVLNDDRARIVHAYEAWGFENLTNDLIDVLSIWARFIFDPLLEDKVRSVAQGIAPGAYGRKEAFAVHQGLKKHGPVRIPREFVFMDRAAIGLGGVFLRLNAELNYFQIYNELIENFSLVDVETRQREAFDLVGVPVPS